MKKIFTPIVLAAFVLSLSAGALFAQTQTAPQDQSTPAPGSWVCPRTGMVMQPGQGQQGGRHRGMGCPMMTGGMAQTQQAAPADGSKAKPADTKGTPSKP